MVPLPRVKAGFFSNKICLEFLLCRVPLAFRNFHRMLIQSFFYSYLNTCEQSPKKGPADFHFGKKEGGPSNNEVSSNDKTWEDLNLFIQDRNEENFMKRTFSKIKWLKNGRLSQYFFHFHHGACDANYYL